MSIIDAHIHYGDNATGLLALLDEFDLKLLNICYVQSPDDPWREQADRYQSLTERYPSRFAWCTSFDLPRFDDPNYIATVLAGLERDFAAGAIACKVWKNIGMGVRKPDGTFLMIDDPLFDPIFSYLAAANRTLLMHIAEPLACWQPLDEHNPHYGYYSRNPEWHMYGKSGVRSHGELIAARDHVIERYPELRIVGAHFGSLEYDVDEVAARLARYPNFAVDISARLGDIAIQDSSKVRQFFIDHQDRILFGTDVVMEQRPSQMAPSERDAAINMLRSTYATHFAYFEQDGKVTVRGRETQALALPQPVLAKFYHDNALRWYPGL